MAVTILPETHNAFRTFDHATYVIRRHPDGGPTIVHGLKCSHRGGPLWLGALDGDFVQCPWHKMRTKIPDYGTRRAPFCLARSGRQIYVVGAQVLKTFRLSLVEVDQ